MTRKERLVKIIEAARKTHGDLSPAGVWPMEDEFLASVFEEWMDDHIRAALLKWFSVFTELTVKDIETFMEVLPTSTAPLS